MILNSMKSELRYDIRSKFLIIFALILTVIMCGMVYIQYVQIGSAISSFRAAALEAEDMGSSVEKQLSQEFKIIREDNGFMNARGGSNPVSAYKYYVEQDMKNLSLGNAASSFCGTGQFYLPLVFSLVGLFSMRRDVKNKTLKVKICKYGKNSYILSKLLYLTLMSGAVLLISMAVAMAANRIAYSFSLNDLNTLGELNKYIELDSVPFSLTRLISQYLFTWAWSLIYLYLGILFSQITRNTTVGAIALFVLNYIVPTSKKYDPRNIILCYIDKFFDFYGDFFINCIEVRPIALAIPIAIAVLAVVLTITINRSRSAYV